MVTDAEELERLRAEAAALRALVRELSAKCAAAIATLPIDAAFAVAHGSEPGAAAPFRLDHWHESTDLARTDVHSELALLWRRLPSRENA